MPLRTRSNKGPGRRRSRRATAATVLLTLGLAALGGAPAQAEPAPAAKQLVYQGHRFTVPSSWKVVDLAKNPTACVRFDQHAVYLGQPAADQDCPSHAVGRTEALLVEPAANPADRQGTVARPDGREYRAKAADVSITATYDTNPALVRSILTGADVPTAAPRVQESEESPGLLAAEATAAALPATATNYTGKGFDTCAAPSSGAMSSWQASSPYSAVGIYIGGSQRACSQPNLTASWVQQQADDGWRFVPIYVGTQASGITSPASQGIGAANDAISNATALGFGPGSTLYYDMEAYSSSYTSKVLTFESAWTEQLHARGYHSGIYSSSSSGIKDLVDNYSGYTMPDVIFDALWNGVADTADPVVPSSRWSNHQRIHQYSGGHNETWGGTTINIDQDYLDVQISTDTATPHGRVWDRARPDGGPWDPTANLIDEGGAVNAVAAAGLPNGTMHVQALVNGEIWDRTRSATGTWGASSMIDGQGAITDVATAALPDGTLHVQAVVNGEIWDRTRAANGTWSNSTKIDAGGAVTDLASAALPDGTLHVQALVNGEIWDRTRATNGTWGASSRIDAGGAVKDVAAGALPNGTLHVQALVNGEVWDRTRAATGTWGASSRIDAGGAVTQISSAGLPNGDLHVEAVVNGGVWDRVRKGTTGNWSVSSLVDNNGAIFGTYATATPDGTLHIGTNA
ncbi:glycoside hydrolase domain-containing protein [Streptomyces sp. NPDC050535]|uniref:glycoside hydrolase domain-containing protein n=1 Tax=Streptomyces sp. NPDC050535 TaxID=3365626 RepID=UPI003791BEF3